MIVFRFISFHGWWSLSQRSVRRQTLHVRIVPFFPACLRGFREDSARDEPLARGGVISRLMVSDPGKDPLQKRWSGY